MSPLVPYSTLFIQYTCMDWRRMIDSQWLIFKVLSSYFWNFSTPLWCAYDLDYIFKGKVNIEHWWSFLCKLPQNGQKKKHNQFAYFLLSNEGLSRGKLQIILSLHAPFICNRVTNDTFPCIAKNQWILILCQSSSPEISKK